MNIYYILAILCSIGTMVFTYLATQKDGEKTETALKETIKNQSDEIKALSRQNIQLSEIIHSNTKEIIGKDSYPLANIGGGADSGAQTQVIVSLIGEYAIPNLTVKAVVNENYSQVSGLDIRVLGIQNPYLKIGTLKKLEMPSLMVETKTKETAVTLYFSSDNNTWAQSIRIIKTKRGRKSMWYLKDNNGKTLQKYLDKDFPIDKDGKITIWSNVRQKFEEI